MMYGFPQTGDAKPVFIDVRWDHLQQVTQWILKEKIIAVLIVPRWDKHVWYKTLTQRASHRLVLPLGEGLFEERQGQINRTFQMDCFFLDARYDNRSTEKIIEKMEETPPLPPRQILEMQSCEFLK